MKPVIKTITEKKLIGLKKTMTFADNKTYELWKSFMPRRKEILNNSGNELISMQIYTPGFFDHFKAGTEFEKWAAVEVTDFNMIPDEMDKYVLPAGLYAVFIYHGAASMAAKTFQYIFGTWLPNSEYSLDNRPHFEILGEKYRNESLDSEEEFWIPVRFKK